MNKVINECLVQQEEVLVKFGMRTLRNCIKSWQSQVLLIFFLLLFFFIMKIFEFTGKIPLGPAPQSRYSTICKILVHFS